MHDFPPTLWLKESTAKDDGMLACLMLLMFECAEPSICSCSLLTAHILTLTCEYLQAFMGEVAMWTGLVTGTLMFVSPVLFDRLGWRGVAGATPTFMLWAGMPFFAGVVLYTLLPSSAATTLGPAMLRILVIVGAVVQVSVVVAARNAYCHRVLR